MQIVRVIGEVSENKLFIKAVDFLDGSVRTTHLSIREGKVSKHGQIVECYTVYFDDCGEPEQLYVTQHGLWFIDRD